ncbi:hypothetical protein PS1_047152 [Malus domestica]
MTRSSKPVHEHILDFDDDFERTLRKRRNQQESNPPSPEPDLEEQVLEEEDLTAQVGGEVQGWLWTTVHSKSFPPRVWIMRHHCVSNIPWLPKVKPKSSSYSQVCSTTFQSSIGCPWRIRTNI